MGSKTLRVRSDQPRKWRAGGHWERVAFNTWHAALVVVALVAFVIFGLWLLRYDDVGRLPWILWGIGFGAVLFWAGSTVNDMLYRASNIRGVPGSDRPNGAE